MRPSCLTTTLVVESLLAINTVAAAVAAHTLGRLQVLSRGCSCLLTRHALTTSACTRARLRAANDVHQAVYSCPFIFPISFYYSAPDRGAEYCDDRVCLCVCLSVCVFCPRAYLWKNASNLYQFFFCMSPIDVARSSSVSVAIRYVLRFYG